MTGNFEYWGLPDDERPTAAPSAVECAKAETKLPKKSGGYSHNGDRPGLQRIETQQQSRITDSDKAMRIEIVTRQALTLARYRVAIDPDRQGRCHASIVMRAFGGAIANFDIGALSPSDSAFYARFGWDLARLAVRAAPER